MSNKIESNRSLIRLSFWIAGPALGLLQALAHRNDIDEDGVAYLDLAGRFLRGDSRALINAYWSPLYPWLLANSTRFSPPDREALALHLVNLGIYLLVLLSFDFLLNQILFHEADARLPESILRAFGYVLALWCCLILNPLSLSHPDLLVMAAVFCAAAITTRLRYRRVSLIWYPFLGAVLAVGYLAKAAMFPLAFVFLVVAFLVARKSILLLAPLTFVLIAGAYILALSRTEHRITFGDSAKINYAMWVNAIGSPTHTPWKAFEHPSIYVYTDRLAGTSPAWTDPAYWREGVEPKFNLGPQADVVHRSFDIYFSTFTRLSGLLAGFLALLLVSNTRATLRGILGQWLLYVPALAALAMYSLVHVELRFIGGFVALLCTALFLGIRISPETLPFAKAAVLAVVIVLGIQIAWDAGHNIIGLAYAGESSDSKIAKALENLGIQKGDTVGIIEPVRGRYWGRLAGVTMAGIIHADDAPEFWGATPEVKSKIVGVLSKLGVKAFVAQDLPKSLLSGGWSAVERTDYFILPIPSSQ